MSGVIGLGWRWWAWVEEVGVGSCWSMTVLLDLGGVGGRGESSWSWIMLGAHMGRHRGYWRVTTVFAYCSERRVREKLSRAEVIASPGPLGCGQSAHGPCPIQVLHQQMWRLLRATQDMGWAVFLTSISLGD